ncbi:MAG TPA: helix-turn-helix transcriptional regulator [Armatimonadota bacterium]|nr:helix-turn-helix transcriptional regulator [Armatimonadota bacterium]
MTITMTRQRFSGRALRRIRESLDPKMPAAKLARITGIPVDTLRDYERDKYAPDANRLMALARELDVPLDALYVDVDETEEDQG